MGWLQIRKLEYLENGTQLCYEIKKILNLCLRWNILRSYRFVAEVTFKSISYVWVYAHFWFCLLISFLSFSHFFFFFKWWQMPFSFNSYESLLLFLISNSYIFYLRKVYLLKYKVMETLKWVIWKWAWKN